MLSRRRIYTIHSTVLLYWRHYHALATGHTQNLQLLTDRRRRITELMDENNLISYHFILFFGCH